MDRDQLEGWLRAGLSLNEIGALTDRSASTVGYWVQKFGLTANGRNKNAPRGGLTRDQLERLVDDGLTLREIAEEVERSVSTVRHWLKRFGMQTQRHHVNNERARDARALGLSRFEGICRRHGTTTFLAFPHGRSRCARCNTEAVAEHRRRVKQALVDEAGGSCAICGYDRFVGALQFHHRDPAKKEFTVSRRGSTIAIARSRLEAEKCVLLCANCHAEVEGGVASLT